MTASEWRKRSEEFWIFSYRSLALQFGQVVSFRPTTNPQFLHVLGWESPIGAPQATHCAAPISFAEVQYKQTVRRNFSDS